MLKTYQDLLAVGEREADRMRAASCLGSQRTRICISVG